jgi:hypothetical protein
MTVWAERKAALTQQCIASCENCLSPISTYQGFYRCKPCSTAHDVRPGEQARGIFCHRCYERTNGNMAHFMKHAKGSNYWNVCLSTRDYDAKFSDGGKFSLKCQGFCNKSK